MVFAIIGYAVLLIAAFICAYLSSRRAIESAVLQTDYNRFVDTLWRIEGFNRSLLLNLLLGSVGVCCTAMPSENLVAFAVAVLLALVNFVAAFFVADVLLDAYKRLDDGPRYNCVKCWRTGVFILTATTFGLGLLRFHLASSVELPNGKANAAIETSVK